MVHFIQSPTWHHDLAPIAQLNINVLKMYAGWGKHKDMLF